MFAIMQYSFLANTIYYLHIDIYYMLKYVCLKVTTGI